MPTEVLTGQRERRDRGAITQKISFEDVGKKYDFMRLAEGFTITNVNLSVHTAFDNADNKVSVGIEGEEEKFISKTEINAPKAVNMEAPYFTAPKNTSILLNIEGTKGAEGEAEITVDYLKLASVKQDY
ncbi:MAG: hypothetical protein CR967_04610 [Proteobacteria bacterium]|nr:MAG: hypothetical protein CR967_04610 [Pseudomonadota bacterium]